MAIQFLRAQYVSRSQGKNACCQSAYNARATVADERTNVTYTFKRLEDNVYHKILLPTHASKEFENVTNFVPLLQLLISSSIFVKYKWYHNERLNEKSPRNSE